MSYFVERHPSTYMYRVVHTGAHTCRGCFTRAHTCTWWFTLEHIHVYGGSHRSTYMYRVVVAHVMFTVVNSYELFAFHCNK